MSRYLYGRDGSTIGYMDTNEKYLYSTAGATIAYGERTTSICIRRLGKPSATSIFMGVIFIRNQGQ